MIKPSLNAFSDPAGVSENRRVLKSVILYDNLSGGKRAMQALEGATHEFATLLQLEPQLWRLDFLETPHWRNCARADVVTCDTLFISVTIKNTLPGWFQSWLCACLSEKRDKPAAVVALLASGSNPDASGAGKLLWLEEAAREAGCDFFSSILHEEHLTPSSSLETIEQRRPRVNVPIQPFPSVYSEPLNHSTYHHGGINE